MLPTPFRGVRQGALRAGQSHRVHHPRRRDAQRSTKCAVVDRNYLRGRARVWPSCSHRTSMVRPATGHALLGPSFPPRTGWSQSGAPNVRLTNDADAVKRLPRKGVVSCSAFRCGGMGFSPFLFGENGDIDANGARRTAAAGAACANCETKFGKPEPKFGKPEPELGKR